MAQGSMIISELEKLISLPKNSPYIYTTAKELLYQAFRDPKPLFKSKEEKVQAGELLNTSLPRLEFSLTTFHGSLSPDLRQTAQRFRSGLQFLVDEVDGEVLHRQIKTILTCSAIKCIEQYIYNTTGIPPEFPTPESQDQTEIPPSHIWWKDDDTDEDN